MTDDRFDEILHDASREYREPPAVPREEIWARIEAARARAVKNPATVVDLPRRQTWSRLRGPVLIAAVLVLGIALGRFLPRVGERPDQPAAAGASLANPAAPLAARVAAVEHLSRVEAWLVDFEAGPTDRELIASARELLVDTRLWLDGSQLRDPRLRALLEDLELILTQIVELKVGDDEDRSLVTEGIAERHIRPRLRDAVPLGPTA